MASAGSYHKIPEPDDLIQCPYDVSHLIRFKKLVYHLMKCRQNHPSACMTCPFDARHQVPKVEWNLHMVSCPQRALIEKDVAQHLLADASTLRGDVTVPPYDAWKPPEPAENWDTDDDSGAVTYREPGASPLRDRLYPTSDSDCGEPSHPKYGVGEHKEPYASSSKNVDVLLRHLQVTANPRVCEPHDLASAHVLGQSSPIVPVMAPETVSNKPAKYENLPSSDVPHPVQPQSAWSKPLLITGTSGLPPTAQQPSIVSATKFTPGARYPSPSYQSASHAVPFGLSPAVGRGRGSVRLPATKPTALPESGRPALHPVQNETRHDIGRSRIAANFNRTPIANQSVLEPQDTERAAGDQESLLKLKLKRITKKLRQINILEKRQDLDEDQKRKVSEKSGLERERERIAQELEKLKNNSD